MPSQEDINNQLKLLEIQRRNLGHYQRQVQFYGAIQLCPPVTVNGYNESVRNIKRIKGILRDYNVYVEDEPGEDTFI